MKAINLRYSCRYCIKLLIVSNSDHLIYNQKLLMFCSVDRADPFCSAAGQHFNQLLRRFGAPVVILNLVKVGF